MRNFFENLNTDNDIPDDLYEEMRLDPANVQRIILEKIAQLRSSYTEADIAIVHDVGEQIPNHSRLFYLHHLYHFFIDHVALMLEQQHFFAIYVLVDLFIYNGCEVLELSVEDNVRFLNAVYPVLGADIDLSELSSFHAIACMRIVDNLLEHKSGKMFNSAQIPLLEQFKKDYPERYRAFTDPS